MGASVLLMCGILLVVCVEVYHFRDEVFFHAMFSVGPTDATLFPDFVTHF